IWSMSQATDVENQASVTGLVFNKGVLSGTATGPTAQLTLHLDESPTRALHAESYHAISFRMFRAASAGGATQVTWTDDTGARSSVNLAARPGWHVYRVHLSGNPSWREKTIHGLEIKPSTTGSTSFSLDWFRLEANVVWNFDSLDETYGTNGITGISASGGSFSGTSGTDPYLYLSTDQRDINRDADRAYIDAAVFKKIRVRMSSTAIGTGQVFWWKRGQTSGQFSEVIFPVLAGLHTYEIDLSSNPNWSGEVTKLRLDPIDSAGVNFTVDRISAVPVMLAPRIVNSDPIVNSPTPAFLWEGANEPERSGVTFTVELARDFEFTTPLFTRSGLTAGRCVYDGAAALDGSYWWRVRAQDASGAMSPWATPMPMFVRPWTFDRPLDVLSSNQISSPLVSGGVFTGSSLGFDPYVYFNTGSPINRGINADVYKRLVVRARINADNEYNVGQLFFFPKSGGFRDVAFGLPADNQWHDIEVDLSGVQDWKGYIESVRLDPLAEAGVEVSLDHFYFLPAASSVSLANQVPQFAKGADQVVTEDSAGATVNGWVTASSPGAGENWQTLDYIITTSNPGLFAVAPAVSPVGTLTFQPAADAHGSATVSVRVRDNGGTANGGVDISLPQTFTITVTPVNDSPVAENDSVYAHSQVVNAIPAAALLANDIDIDDDVLGITAVTSPSAAGAAVSLAGAVVNYQPLGNQTGADSLQYTVADGQGGQSNAQVAVTVIQPQVTEWSVNGGMLRLGFQAIPNRNYQLQTSEDLKTWSEVTAPVTNASGALLWEQVIVPGEPLRFYRFTW
ncbi:MAG: hypothetical protein RLZZ522_1353, partial [Verrucomicrobiota bacterium]